MICLKNRTFAVSQTTVAPIAVNAFLLWFAWKIVLLQYHKQPSFAPASVHRRCDLLEKSYFCSITNNCTSLRYWYFELWFAWKIVLLQYHKQPSFQLVNYQLVVICLKNRTFAVSQTTVGWKTTKVQSLWFAWKIVLLQYHKQLEGYGLDFGFSCDLLEKSYFCSITNNLALGRLHLDALWFAWKIVLLQYHKQPIEEVERLFASCDLLEKSYFCSITNN